MGKRKSKYENLVCQIITVEYKDTLYDVKVTDTRMVEKVSKKTGRIYKVRRMWVCLAGSANELEIGTQSWNKKSFMRNLLKVEGVDFVVKNESKKEETKKSTIRFENGAMYGTIADLIDWGRKYDIWEQCQASYSFDVYKNKIEEVLDSKNRYNTFAASRKLSRIKREVREAMHDYINLVDAEANETLEINVENVNKLARAILMESCGHKIIELCNSTFDTMRNDNRSSSNSSSTFDRDYLYNFIISQNSSKYGFDKCQSQREVKSLYRKLSKELHPDIIGGDEANFIEMKKEYDRALHKYA